MTFDPNDPRRVRDESNRDRDPVYGREKNRGATGWILGIVIAGLLAFLLWPRGTTEQASAPNAERPAGVANNARTGEAAVLAFNGKSYRAEGTPVAMQDAEMAMIGRDANGQAIYVPKAVQDAAAGGGGGMAGDRDTVVHQRLYTKDAMGRYQLYVER